MWLEDIKLIIMDRRSYMLMNLKSLAQGGCAQSKKGKDLVASPHLVNLKKSGIVEELEFNCDARPSVTQDGKNGEG